MKPHIGIYTCVISRNYDCLPFSRCLQYLVWTHMSYILTLQGFVFSADRMQWANKGGGGGG